MIPATVTAACVGLLSGLTTVSTKIRSLAKDARNTNQEVLALRKELDAFQRSLSVFYGSGQADRYPDHLHTDLKNIIRECKHVVDEIEQLLDSVRDSRINQQMHWSFTVRDEVSRLHRNLEGHKSAITIAIALASMNMTSGIKSDTSSIRSKAALIPDIQEQLAVVIQAIYSLNSGDPTQRPQLSLAMQRFLQDAYTESVSGTMPRGNSFRTYRSAVLSAIDPFEDPKSVSKVSVVEESKFMGDDGYRSASTSSHSDITSKTIIEDLGLPEVYVGNKQTTCLPVSAENGPCHILKVPERSPTGHVDVVTPGILGNIKRQRPFSFGSTWPQNASMTSKNNITPSSADHSNNVSLSEVSTEMTVRLHAAVTKDTSNFCEATQAILSSESPFAHSGTAAMNAATLQQALAMHQTGQFELATERLKSIAEYGFTPSWIVYALSLRHGWGCAADESSALAYLYAAALVNIDKLSRSDFGEDLRAAFSRELGLALFEIGNCLRHGWGCSIKTKSAKYLYGTAANFGNLDATQELAWCYLEGFGTKKNKFAAAQLLRQTEQQGVKVLGNSWIWKEKYDRSLNLE